MVRHLVRNPLLLLSVLCLGVLYLYIGHTIQAGTALLDKQSRELYSFKELLGRLKLSPLDSTRKLAAEDAFKERDGLLFLSDIARPGIVPGITVEHPIFYLMKKAKVEWQEKVDGQSKTLQRAVARYREKYGRAPPKGFDKFTFARDNNVILVDDYDQLNRDILPFLGLPSKPLQDRSRIMIEDADNNYHKGSFTLDIKNGKLASVTGGQSAHKRMASQSQLMQRFLHLLPDLNITVWIHDTPAMHLSGEKRQELEDLAMQGKTLEEKRWDDLADPAEFVGHEAFCKPVSNVRNAMAGLLSPQYIPEASFITDHYDATDFCRHPGNLPLHSLSNNYGIGPRAVKLQPLFSHSKSSLYADILLTPLEQYGALVGPDPGWEQKTHNKILWRGSTTGSTHNRGKLWRSTQRIRLATLANSKDPKINRTVYTTSTENTSTLSAYDSSLADLNPRFFDILFTGAPIQCRQDDGSCDGMLRQLPFAKKAMRQEEANQYKYIFDVDGNGWSGRFHRLMASKAAVLKSQGYVEWWSDRVQPWLHYIPVKLDYSDLYSIASFFIGDEHSSGHDLLAKEIGQAGKDWAEKHWRMEDMEAYMFRLYLEYARVMNRNPEDPHSMDYNE